MTVYLEHVTIKFWFLNEREAHELIIFSIDLDSLIGSNANTLLLGRLIKELSVVINPFRYTTCAYGSFETLLIKKFLLH